MGFTFGFAPPTIIEAGIRLGIFDLLDSGAKAVHEIAAAVGASRRYARQFFRPAGSRHYPLARLAAAATPSRISENESAGRTKRTAARAREERER